jgi:tetratricopeptide (TPR) repeat protein
MQSFRFEVAFSFAGPHRNKVRTIAEIVLAKVGLGKVFFDEWFEHEILGSDMDVLLQRFYHQRSLMVVADLSEDYVSRRWPQAEARAIRALRMELDPARDEIARLRLINMRFGDGDVPGVFVTEGWYDAQDKTAAQCAEFLLMRHSLLRERISSTATLPPLLKKAPPTLFFHPATNDACYSRREKELKWLDDCAKNPQIRIITVSGQGGLGKTSLVGQWIQKHRAWEHREFRGVFFYSFYSNRDPKAFFEALLAMETNLPVPGRTRLHELAAILCRKQCYLVVLDGLEVLQHGEEDRQYGWIGDGELTEFVARVGEKSASLLVLTSRFPFPRITDEYPDAARALELPLLTDAEGADLLSVCGLTDPRRSLESYSGLLGGHPLALRIFAGACLEKPYDDPEKVSLDVCSAKGVEKMPDPDEPGLSPEEKEKRRQRRQFYKLLSWFQQKYSPPKRRLLQLVSLFRAPVGTDTLVALALGLDAMKADFDGYDAARITGSLDQLSGQFVLQKETSPTDDTLHFTAHPIVRDVFREAALAAGDTVAKQFAEIVAGKGKGERPKTVAEVRPIMEAIEVLLAAGDVESADEIVRHRLENGLVFKCIPAPREGLRCARAFLDSEPRRALLKDTLGRWRLSFYITWRALAATRIGETKGVLEEYSEATVAILRQQSWDNIIREAGNIAEIQILCGSLKDAISIASDGLFYAGGVNRADGVNRYVGDDMPVSTSESWPSADSSSINAFEEEVCLSLRADALSLMGECAAASLDFARADELERNANPESASLFSQNGIKWARHRVRLDEKATARNLVEFNRVLCKRFGWNEDLANCELLLGELDLLAGDLSSAERRVTGALRVFRDAHHVMNLPDALLAMARVLRVVQLTQKDGGHAQAGSSESASAFTGYESPLSHCQESLRLAARSGFVLKKCDALNFRAQLRREAGELDGFLADAKEAHDIATRCDYYWGLHEALRQLRDTAKVLGRIAEFREWDKAERDLAAKMKPEIEEALKINRKHDAEVQRVQQKT